jgi:alpha-L-fucosidase
MQAEEEQDAYKSPTQLIQLLCDVISKNGNLLLNIGPKADGTIPEGMQRRLLAMGAWLDANGEAVYGSRPWKTFGEGKGKAVKGKGKHALAIRPREIRYTQKDRALFVFCLNKPKDSVTLTSTAGWVADDVKSIALLGSDAVVQWEVSGGGVQIQVPDDLPGEHVWVFKIVTPRARLN